MTELTPYQAASPLAPSATPQEIAFQRLAEWAQSADAAYTVATRLVESSFVPQHFRGKPVEATAAILAGTEVGLSPMSALRAFDVIQGQAAPRAITLRAVVQSHGHEMVLVESTETRCVMRGRRRGTSDWQTVTWSMDRALKLGLVNKDNWKKQPGAMLVARATSELARLIASDAILGIGYSFEELSDGDEQAATVTEMPQQANRRTARRRTAQQPAAVRTQPGIATQAVAPEPDFGEDADAETGEPITDPQMKWLQAHYKDVAREDRLAAAALVLGHDVESFSGLTKAQASRLIDHLETEDEHTAALNAEADTQAAGLFGDRP